MSTLDEKLAPAQTTQGHRARATLAQLRARFGGYSDPQTGLDPLWMRVKSMGEIEVWKRISNGVYELEPPNGSPVA